MKIDEKELQKLVQKKAERYLKKLINQQLNKYVYHNYLKEQVRERLFKAMLDIKEKQKND